MFVAAPVVVPLISMLTPGRGSPESLSRTFPAIFPVVPAHAEDATKNARITVATLNAGFRYKFHPSLTILLGFNAKNTQKVLALFPFYTSICLK
jgi:hypothetical protein